MRKFFLFLVFIPTLLNAQERDLINFGLKAAIEKAGPGEEISVYLRGDLGVIPGFVRENGGRVKGLLNGMAAVTLPKEAFGKIAAEPAIAHVEFEFGKGRPLGDQMIINNNVAPVHQGLSLPAAFRGKDVVIGLIDTGIELGHPDFQNEDGTTRVVALWDQKQPADDPQRIPEPYGYGQEYTAEDINAGISGHIDQPQWFGHGSTVTGVALGNANATGDFPGVAPEADIFVVSSDFNRQNWKMTVAEAAEWIFERAAAIGKPAVVNASLGSYLGSHDALDGPALYIDSLLDAAPGRAMICAAGNSQAWDPYHLGYNVPENDTAFTWFVFNPNLGEGGAVFIEAWADVDNFQNTRFTIGADVIAPEFGFRGYAPWRSAAENLNTLMTDTIFYQGANVGIVQSWVGQRGDQYQIQAVVTQPFSNQFRYRFSATGGGRFDVWSSAHPNVGTTDIMSSGLPTPAGYPPMVNYRLPDKQMTMVDSWACSDKVITVGNYVNRTEFENAAGGITEYADITAGDISVNSSSGPTRDFRQKPEIAATGDVTLSAGRLAYLNSLLTIDPTKVSASQMHYVNGGTSMASPVVAGAAALFFERCPAATYQDFREALITTAVADQFTGALPGLRFGYGKLDVFSLMLSANASLPITGLPACEGEEALLTAGGGFFDYVWNTGETGSAISVDQNGTYFVEAADEMSCLQQSQPLVYAFQEVPETPVVFESEGILAAEGAASGWQWYLDDAAIPGAEEPLFEPMQDGSYTVEAIGENGCSAFSEPLSFGTVSTADVDESDFQIFPNPAKGFVRLSAKEGVEGVRLTDLTGKTVLLKEINLTAGRSMELSLDGLSPGLYIVSLYAVGDVYNMKLVIDK